MGRGSEDHWHTCSGCEETLDLAVHTLDEDSICTVCGYAIYTYDDGTYEIVAYDAQGALCKSELYEADGILIYGSRYDYEYDEKGNVTSLKSYAFDPAQGHTEDVLQYEEVYLPCENSEYDEIYMSEQTIYFEDGSKYHSVFNEMNALITSTSYDADGTVLAVERHEPEYDESGNCIRELVYINDVLDTEYCYMVLPDSETVMTKCALYGEDGSEQWVSTYEYEINEDGYVTCQTGYEDGVKTSATYYAVDEDGCRYICQEIEYDENGEIVSQISYDEYGDVIEE